MRTVMSSSFAAASLSYVHGDTAAVPSIVAAGATTRARQACLGGSVPGGRGGPCHRRRQPV